MYTERFYRSWTAGNGLESFRAVSGESDLQIYAKKFLRKEAMAALEDIRARLRDHIARHPVFLRSMVPVETGTNDPFLRSMEESGKLWNTGPMASVAGAIANEVGRLLSEHSSAVIVENGGDVWARSPVPLEFLVYPGEDTPFSAGIPFTVGSVEGVSVCTSSGKVGPSFSMGRADSVTVIHRSGAVADAAATAIANRIRGARDITPVVESIAASRKLLGILAVCGESMGIWGDIKLKRRA